MSYLTEEEAGLENFPSLKVPKVDDSKTEMCEEVSHPKAPDVNISIEKKTEELVSENNEDLSLSDENNSKKEPKNKVLLKTISTVYEDLQKTNEELESLNKNLFTYINKMIDTQKSLVIEDSKSSANDEASKSSYIDETFSKTCSDNIASNFLEADVNKINKRKIDDKGKSESQYCIPVIDSSLSHLDKRGTDVSQNSMGNDFTEATDLSQANDLQRPNINHDNLTAVVVHSSSDGKEQTAGVSKVFIGVESNTSNCSQPNYAYYSYPSYSEGIQSFPADRCFEPNTVAVSTSQDSFMSSRHCSTFEAHSSHSSERCPKTSHSYEGTHKDDYHPQNSHDKAERIPYQYCKDRNTNAVCSDENEGKFEQFITKASAHAQKNTNDPTERQENYRKSDHPSNRKRILDRSEEFVEDSIAQNIIKRYGEYKRNITDKGNEGNPLRPNLIDDDDNNKKDSNESESKVDVVKDTSGPLSRSKFTYGEYRKNLVAKTLGKTSNRTVVKDPIPRSSVTRISGERRSEQPNVSSNFGKRYSDTYTYSKRYALGTTNSDDDSRFTYSANPRQDSHYCNDEEMASSEDEMTPSSLTQPSTSVEFDKLRSLMDSADPNELMPWYLPKQNISLFDGKKESKSICDKNDGSHLIERKERRSSVSEQTSEISRSNKHKESTANPYSQKSDGTKTCERKESRSGSPAQRLDVGIERDQKESKNNCSEQKFDSAKLSERKEVKRNISDKGWDPTKSRYGQRHGKDEISALGERSFNPFSPFSPSLSVDKPGIEKSEKKELVGTSSQKLAVKERDPAEILSAILANRKKDNDRVKKRNLKKSASSSTQERKVITETSKKESSVSKNDKSIVISEPVVSSTNDFVNIDSSLKEKNNTLPNQNVVPDSSTNSAETVSANEEERKDVSGEKVDIDFPGNRESQDADDLDKKEANLSASLNNAVEQQLTDTDIKLSVLNEKRICKVKLVDIFWKAKRDGKFKKKRIRRLIEKFMKKCIRHEKSKLRLLSVSDNNPESTIMGSEITSKFYDTQGKVDEESNIERNIGLSSGDEHEIKVTKLGNTKKRQRLLSNDSEDEIVNEESTEVLLQSNVSDSCNLAKKPKQDLPLSVGTTQEIIDKGSLSDSIMVCPVSHKSPDSEGEREKTHSKFIQYVEGTSESKIENLLESNVTVTDISESGDSGKVSAFLKSNEDSDKIDVTSTEENVSLTASISLVSNEIPSESTVISSIKEGDKGNADRECNLKKELLNLPEIVEDNPEPVSADSTSSKVQLIITDMDAAVGRSGIKVDLCVKDHSEENSSASQRNTTLKSVSDDLNVQSENSGISLLCEDTSSSSLPLPIIENVTNEINKSLLEIDSTPNTLIEASSDSSEEEEFPFLKNLDSFLTDLSKFSGIGENVSSACDSSGELSTVDEGGKFKVDVRSSEYASNVPNSVASSSIKETNVAASEKYDNPNVKEETKCAFNEEQSKTSHSKQSETASSSCVSFAEVTDSNFKDEVQFTENNSEEGNSICISSSKKQNISDVEKGNSVEIKENSSSASLNNEIKKPSSRLEGEHATFTSSEQVTKSEEDKDFEDKTGSSVRSSGKTNSTDSSSVTNTNVASSVIDSPLDIEEKGNSVISNEDLHISTDSEVDKTDGIHLSVPENFVDNSVFLNLGKSHIEREEEGNSHDQVLDKSISLLEQQQKHANRNIDLLKEENKSCSEVLVQKIKIKQTVTVSNENYSGIESLKLEKHLKTGKGEEKPDKKVSAVIVKKEKTKSLISGSEDVSFPNKEKCNVEERKIEKDVRKTKKKKFKDKEEEEEEKGDGSNKSKKFTESEKKSISGGNRKDAPLQISVKTTEKSKCEPGVELTKKDSSQVKARIDATESSKPSSTNSELVVCESSVIVSSDSMENYSGIDCPKLEKHLIEGEDIVKRDKTSTTLNIDKEGSKNSISANENVSFSIEEKQRAEVRVKEDVKKAKMKKIEGKEKGHRSGKSKKFTESEKTSISGDNRKNAPSKISVKTLEKSKCEPGVELTKKDSSQVKPRIDATESRKPSSTNSELVEFESSVIVSHDSNENYSGLDCPKLEKHLIDGEGIVKPDKTSTTLNIDKEDSKNSISANENVSFPIEEKRGDEVRVKEDVKKAKNKKVEEKEKGHRSGKSKKFTESKKNSISGGNRKNLPSKISLKTTENPNCESGFELTKKDSSQLIDRLDSTLSSNPSSANNEPAEGESSVIVSEAHERIGHSVSNEGPQDDSKKKTSKSSKSEIKDKNRDILSQVSSDKNTTRVEKIENIRDSCKESEKSVTENIDEDRKLENRKSPERNPIIDDHNLQGSRTSHSIKSEQKSSSDVEDKNEREQELPSEDKHETTKSSKRSNLFMCIVCKKKYCTNKRKGTRLGNYSKRIAAFCQNCYIDLYKTSYSSIIRKLRCKKKSKEK